VTIGEQRDRRRVSGMAISALVFAVLLVLLGMAVLLSLRHSLRPAHHQTQSASYGGVTAIASHVDRADLTVRPGSGKAVTIRRTLAWSQNRPRVAVTQRGGTLSVDASCPSEAGFPVCHIALTVTVPKTMPLSLDTESGDVTVTGLTGPLKTHTVSGDITLRDLSGVLDLHADSGNVTATHLRSRTVRSVASSGDTTLGFATAPDSVRATASSGDIAVQVPLGPDYAISSQVSSGDKHIDVPNTTGAAHQISLVASSGDLRVDYASD